MDVNLGVGIGTLIGSLNSQNVTYQMPNSGNIFIGCLFIVIGCIGWIVVTALNKWKLNKAFAIFHRRASSSLFAKSSLKIGS